MVTVTYPCYIERKDSKGHWYWIYYAKNKEEIARSSESYVKKLDCDYSISLIKGSKDDPEFYYD